jgi:hypothetical protein
MPIFSANCGSTRMTMGRVMAAFVGKLGEPVERRLPGRRNDRGQKKGLLEIDPEEAFLG